MTVKELRYCLEEFPDDADILITAQTGRNSYYKVTQLGQMRTINTETGEEIITPVLVF